MSNPRQFHSHVGTVRRADGGGIEKAKEQLKSYVESPGKSVQEDQPARVTPEYTRRMQSQQDDINYIYGKMGRKRGGRTK